MALSSMLQLASFFLLISSTFGATSDFQDPADIEPLAVLIKEIKQRMRDLSKNIDKDIAALEVEKGHNASFTSQSFPEPKPLFERLFTPDQLKQIESPSSSLHDRRNLDHKGKKPCFETTNFSKNLY